MRREAIACAIDKRNVPRGRKEPPSLTQLTSSRNTRDPPPPPPSPLRCSGALAGVVWGEGVHTGATTTPRRQQQQRQQQRPLPSVLSLPRAACGARRRRAMAPRAPRTSTLCCPFTSSRTCTWRTRVLSAARTATTASGAGCASRSRSSCTRAGRTLLLCCAGSCCGIRCTTASRSWGSTRRRWCTVSWVRVARAACAQLHCVAHAMMSHTRNTCHMPQAYASSEQQAAAHVAWRVT